MRSNIFKMSNILFDKRIISLYNNYLNNKFLSKKGIEKVQLLQLNKMLRFCYENVEYYRNIFNENNIIPDDINTLNDLEKIPVLTKFIINENREKFIPENIRKLKYSNGSTGGTTGSPLKYYVDQEQRIRGITLLYLGFSNAGYEFGDKIIFLGGSSIGGSNNLFTKYFYKYGLNFYKLSSFDLEEENLRTYFDILKKEQPLFIRGYASSIFFLADWIERNQLKIQSMKGVFTTSEKLHDYMRKTIERVFSCKVFDGYGLADGGITAFECNHHQGMHIDYQISIMEVVDKDNKQIFKNEGRVLATSLYNYSFPFIRYETDDLASITNQFCTCGRQTDRIIEIVGRSVDILFTPEGKNIHGWFFLYIFWEHCKGISQYQVVQKDLNNIIIKIVKNKEFDNSLLKTIERIVFERSPKWKLHFEFVDIIESTKAGKYKFIINEINS